MTPSRDPLSAITPARLDEYVAAHARRGIRSIPGSSRAYVWMRAQSLTLGRFPKFVLDTPEPGEISHMFARGRAVLVTYVTRPDPAHPASAWLYECRDHAYSLEGLDDATRRNIRRAERELRFEMVDWPRLRRHGFAAFRGTRLRHGLSDGTEARFVKRFGLFYENPAHHVLGAWRGEDLVAFMTLVVVDDWVEIGGFSRTESLPLRPNNGLVHRVLTHFLRDRRATLVSYGLSSVQEESQAAGLHRFKLKTGFEATPVHRAFMIHPILVPLANRGTLGLVRLISRSLPGRPWLKKVAGAFAAVMQNARRPSLVD